MRLTFLGAAGEVTGSCYLLEGVGERRLRLLVDCGLFQGGREARRKNLDAFAFNLFTLDAVLITHAHLDHSGLLPRLVALGYRGPVYATAATCDLLEVMLLDSAHIQEKEMEWESRRRHGRFGAERGTWAPLYTVAQAQACLRQLRPLAYDAPLELAPDVRAVWHDAGHILGSAIVELAVGAGEASRRLVFSGDLGQPARPVVRDPTAVRRADVLLIESTYGNRLHRSLKDTEDELVSVLQEVLHRRRGNVVIPAFAVGRTQEILTLLADLVRHGRLDGLNVYVDSPMASAATRLTLKHRDLLDAQTLELLAWLPHNEHRMRVRFVDSVEESMALNEVRGGAIIISASGMCDAGRIRHHLRYNLPRRECAVVICGFQARGTLGRRLVDGAREVTLFGEPVRVRASVHTVGGLSAHADQGALLAWLGNFAAPPQQCFVVHGEQEAAAAFAGKIRETLQWHKVDIPALGQEFDLAQGLSHERTDQ